MYDWQHDCQQKQLFYPELQEECLFQCKEEETHEHYLIYKDTKIGKTQSEKIRSICTQLTTLNTHPMIINMIVMYFTKEPEETLEYIDNPTDAISVSVKALVQEIMHLSQLSFQKGFLSTKWHTAQKQWAMSMGKVTQRDKCNKIVK